MDVWKDHYADFKGRATRQEYWMFDLFNSIILMILFALMEVTGSGFFALLTFIYYIATFIPTLALNVRRFHDTGVSGWMTILCLVPFVGGIILLVFACLDGHPTNNRYGPNPKKFIYNAEQSQVVQPPQQQPTNPTQTPSIENDFIFCSECGQKNPNENFCIRCGKELTKG